MSATVLSVFELGSPDLWRFALPLGDLLILRGQASAANEAFDLVISDHGSEQFGLVAGPLLAAMHSGGEKVPLLVHGGKSLRVTVFILHLVCNLSQVNANFELNAATWCVHQGPVPGRKEAIIRLGAIDYTYRWEALFGGIQKVRMYEGFSNSILHFGTLVVYLIQQLSCRCLLSSSHRAKGRFR